MRDYEYEPGITVSQMSIKDIRECLDDGVVLHPSAPPGLTVEAVIARLRLEIDIRKFEGRQ